MLALSRSGVLLSMSLSLTICSAICQLGFSADSDENVSVHEIRALLNSIDPYLPSGEVRAEIDLFGSTSMDSLVHSWANDFKKFHPQAKVVISAEGSETVFDRLAKNHASIGMISRPVSDEDLAKLKAAGLKRPVAVMVARQGLAVFVNEGNPLASITQDQFYRIFCAVSPTEKLAWKELGVSGTLADKPLQVLARNRTSGTQKFINDFLFEGQTLRAPVTAYASNAEVMKAVEENAAGVAITGLKCGGHGAKVLDLRAGTTIMPHDDHAVLMGNYPLIRPLTLVLDAGQNDDRAQANREFVRYALHQSGQTQTIVAGFFPFDPPTLRGEMLKLEQHTGK